LHDYLPAHKGGSEIHAHQTAAELACRGHEVTALFTERDLSAEEGTVREGVLDGVRTLEVVHQREYADVRETWEEPRSLALFRRAVAALSPDVVHFHHLVIWGAAALGAAREAGARVVLTLHDYWALCDAATLLRPEGELCTEAARGACTRCLRRHPVLPERWGFPADADREAMRALAAQERLAWNRGALAAADRVISPSRFLAEVFERAGFLRAADCTILKAGYPGPVRAPRRRDPRRPLRVGYVGGIYFSKGVHVLVEAFGHLRGAPLELDVHGHLDWFPDYVQGLQRAAEGLPVRFHGPFDPPRLDEILTGVDVLVVPSVWYENMPITIQEAFRNGIPVVVTDLGGMAEAVEHDVSGLVFPRGDARALAERLRALATDAALYDRIAAGRPAVPTLAEVVDRLEEIYGGAR
jgi:glycosyltransferase involved in cell wall biosynthesis